VCLGVLLGHGSTVTMFDRQPAFIVAPLVVLTDIDVSCDHIDTSLLKFPGPVARATANLEDWHVQFPDAHDGIVIGDGPGILAHEDLSCSKGIPISSETLLQDVVVVHQWLFAAVVPEQCEVLLVLTRLMRLAILVPLLLTLVALLSPEADEAVLHPVFGVDVEVPLVSNATLEALKQPCLLAVLGIVKLVDVAQPVEHLRVVATLVAVDQGCSPLQRTIVVQLPGILLSRQLALYPVGPAVAIRSGPADNLPVVGEQQGVTITSCYLVQVVVW